MSRLIVFFCSAITFSGVSSTQSEEPQAFDDHACGVRAIRRVLELYGTSVDFGLLYKQSNASPEGGVSVKDLADCLRHYGLSTRVITSNSSIGLTGDNPAVVYVDRIGSSGLGHFFVLECGGTGRLSIWDGVPGLADSTRQAWLSQKHKKVYILVGEVANGEPKVELAPANRVAIGFICGGCVLLLALSFGTRAGRNPI